LAIALAKKFPEARVIAVDISPDALDVARENAIRNETSNVEFRLGNVMNAALVPSIVGEIGLLDIVVANPPYVTKEQWAECSPSVRDFEPELALVSADQGLAHAKFIVEGLRHQALASQAVFAMELANGDPARLAQELGLSLGIPFHVFSFHTPIWDVARETWFALRDLEARARFLCRVNGL
jgi:release factor glutamine methyltransferase